MSFPKARMTLSRFLILFFCMIFLNQCSSYKNAVLKISPRAKVFSRTSSLQLNIETSSPVAKEGGKRTIAKVIGLLSVMLNPAIGGGFLSGGLHAITGNTFQRLHYYPFNINFCALNFFVLQGQITWLLCFLPVWV